jgi:hypothetical protein
MTIEEMWIRLIAHQPFADQRGYGAAWAHMCEERTPEAAKNAEAAVWSELKAARCTGVATWAALAAWATSASLVVSAVEWITESEKEKE